jgi:hypothetical protein
MRAPGGKPSIRYRDFKPQHTSCTMILSLDSDQHRIYGTNIVLHHESVFGLGPASHLRHKYSPAVSLPHAHNLTDQVLAEVLERLHVEATFNLVARPLHVRAQVLLSRLVQPLQGPLGVALQAGPIGQTSHACRSIKDGRQSRGERKKRSKDEKTRPSPLARQNCATGACSRCD